MGSEETVRVSELINFLPKQQQALDEMWRGGYLLYGGARGPGKSYFLRWAAICFLLNCFLEHGMRNVRAGLFCETYPDLRDRQISKINTEFPIWLGEVKETQEDGLCFFLREGYGGGKIALRNLDDPAKYQSAEFAAIFIDELTKITYDTFNILRGSKRWPGLRLTPFVAASNPGGIGHMWVKQLWIDRAFPPELTQKANEFHFVKALPSDNPYLDQSYWDELNSLPEELRRAWVDGDWNVFAGRALPGWSSRNVITPRQLPAHWPRWRAVDWGYAVPFCCLWFAKDPDIGRVYVYREAYAIGLTDRQQARLIKELTPPDERITLTYADPSMFARKQAGDIKYSTADEYASEQVPLTAADNDRLAGKRKIDRALMNLPDGEPGLQVFDNCANLIRTLPSLAYDKARVEDVDTTQEDHAYDTLKYGLTNERMKPKAAPADPIRSMLEGIRHL